MTPLWLVLALLQQPDSQATLRSARRAQADFESFRRSHLPERDGYSGQNCDRYIGRYCFWYGDQEKDSVPEPSTIGEARARLLARLADAAALLPGDDWIMGQRVRYLIEDGRPRDGLAVARECRATSWWCTALAGLSLHVAAAFAEADSAFAAALYDMPETERCRWDDVSLLLEGELRDRYDHMSCDERAAFASRWWWLAAPLLSRPGNDRRTEHFARITLARIESDSRLPYRDFWGDDLQEILIRFGPDVYWTRAPPSAAVLGAEPIVTGHERVPAFHFVPASHAFETPGHAVADDWSLSAPAAPELYAPVYADTFTTFDAQVSAFRRDDSCLVVARYDASIDPAHAHQDARAALALADGVHAPRIAAHETRLDGPDVLSAITSCEPQIVSLEIVPARARWIARLRRGIDPGASQRVSDLLIVAAADSLPARLDSVLPRAFPTAQVTVGSRVGLFWETYALPPGGEDATISLSVTARRRAAMGRIAESIGLASRRRGVALQWDELLRPERAGEAAPRLLTVDLSGLAPGRYMIELSLNIGTAAPITASREIELVRP
jgi:hypothetical protein